MSGRRRKVFIHFAPDNASAARAAANGVKQSGRHAVMKPFGVKRTSLAAEVRGSHEKKALHLVLLSRSLLSPPFFRSEWLGLYAAGYEVVAVLIEDLDPTPWTASSIPLILWHMPQEQWGSAISRWLRDGSLPNLPEASETRQNSERTKRDPTITNIRSQSVGELLAQEEVLAAIRASFQSIKNSRGVKLQVLTGWAGSGKSSFAAAYAAEVAEELDLVWWINGEDPVSLQEGLIELGERLAGEKANLSVASALEAFRGWSRSGSKQWLLIFDGLNDTESGLGLLNSLPSGQVLITTRSVDVSPRIPQIRVDILDIDAAAEYLLEKTGRKEKPAARRLAAMLGGETVALRSAACWVRATGGSLRDFERRLDSHTPAQRWLPWNYGSHVRSTIEISFTSASSEYARVGTVLARLSLLANESVDLMLLNSIFSSAPRASREAVLIAIQYGLITMDEEQRIRMHPLVATVLSGNESIEDVRNSVAKLSRFFVERTPGPLSPMRCFSRLQSEFGHGRNVLSWARQLGLRSPEVAELARRQGGLLAMEGRYRESVELLAFAYETCSGNVAQSSRVLRDLVQTLKQADLPNSAESLSGHIKQVKGTLTAESPDGRTSGDEIRADFHGRLAEALELHQRGVEAFRVGDRDLAASLLAEAVDIRSTDLGIAHPVATTSRLALSLVLVHSGHYDTSRWLLSDCLRLSSRYFGPDAPVVRDVLEALVFCELQAGRPLDAVRFGTEAFRIRSRTDDFGGAAAVDATFNFGKALLRLRHMEAALDVFMLVRKEAARVWQDDPDASEELERLIEEVLRDFSESGAGGVGSASRAWLCSTSHSPKLGAGTANHLLGEVFESLRFSSSLPAQDVRGDASQT